MKELPGSSIAALLAFDSAYAGILDPPPAYPVPPHRETWMWRWKRPLGSTMMRWRAPASHCDAEGCAGGSPTRPRRLRQSRRRPSPLCARRSNVSPRSSRRYF